IAATNKPLCPPQDLLLNPDFEQGTTPVGWAQHANSECLSTVIQEPTAAHTGEQFARVSKTATCYSLFQDIYREPKAGDTATFGLWVRGQDAKPTRVSLQLFGLDAPLTTNRADYFLTDDGWTCVQVQLHIEESIYRYWRSEIYFHDDGTDYDLDSAQFRLDEKSVCPQGSYAITGLDLVPGQSAVVGATLSGRLTVVNTGEHPAPATQTRYWLADSKQGPPLHSESMGSLELSTLAAEESQLYYFDLRLPLDIESDKAYYLLSELSTGSIDTTTDLPSIRLQIEPCFGETIFCDIPDGYWAQPEAEAAYAAGVTGGCRSDAQAYHNLPFCPNQILWPEQMAVFFLRYINGGNYRPVGRFQSHYIDVTEGQNFAHWIDAFYPVIGDFARANCLQIDETRRFCPDQPVLRRDLLLAIGRILDIDLQQIDSPLTQTTHYVDLQDDPAVETLASYFWAKRILPDMDPNCPDQGFGPRFCGNDVARRVDAIVWMARAFSSEFSN
ncbi:MAG: hypothetical protein KDE19_10775, partial [Caldilineaceae bacterium]|nr:hypothetical protein [Caldilineaceae bacterium]